MVHPQNKVSLRVARRSFFRLFAILSLAVLALMALSTAPRSLVSAKLTPKAAEIRAERNNPRLRASAETTVPLSAPAPFAPISVDRTDDAPAASACTAAANDCSLRGAVTFANLNPGTEINLPAGTYNLAIAGGAGEGFSGNNAIGDIDITANNTSIVGAGAGSTTINQTQPNDRVVEVNPFLLANFTFSISGVSITGGKETTAVGGGGLIAGSINNNTTISNCSFAGNSATGAGTFGGGAVQVAGGSLTITGSTFTSNSSSGSGGAVAYSAGDPLNRRPSLGTLIVSGSAFAANTAGSIGAGGGALDLFDYNGSISSYSINSSSFSSNSAANGSGGAIIVESGALTLITSSLSANSAANRGGAIYSSGTVGATFSRFVGNTVPTAINGLTIFSVSGADTAVGANDNWWGINTGPSANDIRNPGGSVFPLSYLTLSASANPTEVCSGGTSTITADIKQRNVGAALTVELTGLPAFPATFNNAVLGSVSPSSTNFVDGVATSTFTAGGTEGAGSVDATGDNQTVTANVNVVSNATTDPADQSVCEGQTATFTTSTSGPGPVTYVWKKGATVLNNGDLGGRVTIVSGASTSTLTISNAQPGDADTFTVEATGACGTNSQTATLSVSPNTTATDPTDQTVCQGALAGFSTTATGSNLHYSWTLDGSPFGGDTSSISVSTGSLTTGAHTVGLTVTGDCGTVTHSATLNVQANTTASDPADVTTCQGGTANFSTTATGTDIHYVWTLDGTTFNGDTSSISIPTGSLSVGAHSVVLVVTGECGTVTQSATLNVQAPTATSDPADQSVCQGTNASFSTTASGTGPFYYAWTVDGLPFGGDTSSITVPTGSLSVGNHTVTVTTTGSCGSASQSANLNVTAPTPVINLSSNSASMWPPNHKYETFNVSDFVSSATGGCDSNTNLTNSVVIQSVSSDEPEDNPSGGDGNTLNDIVISPDCKSVQLRSERDGNRNGRVYTITFKVTDSFGNTGTATVKISVPKSNNGTPAVDDGPGAGYTVISACP